MRDAFGRLDLIITVDECPFPAVKTIMSKKLYVGNLGCEVDSLALEQLFAAHGMVNSAQIISDQKTGQSQGFGFVEMGSDDEANAAITLMHGKDLGGRALTVYEARRSKIRPPIGGYSSGRSGQGAASGGGRSRN